MTQTIEWISREEWEAMTDESHAAQQRIEQARRMGKPIDHLYKRIAPLRQRIRSPYLKVRGIDDRPR